MKQYDAADGVAAVERGSGPTQDLHALDEIHVREDPAAVGQNADRKTLGDRSAADLRRHAIAADAANREAVDAEAHWVVAHRDAWLVAHQIADVAAQRGCNLLAPDDRDGRRGRCE